MCRTAIPRDWGVALVRFRLLKGALPFSFYSLLPLWTLTFSSAQIFIPHNDGSLAKYICCLALPIHVSLPHTLVILEGLQSILCDLHTVAARANPNNDYGAMKLF